MKKDDLVYIGHINECILKIEEYMNSISMDEFIINTEKQDAVIRNFEIIGEATAKISIEFKMSHNEFPWRKMKSMRNFLIHDYDEIDMNLIWETIKLRLPDLKAKIEKILN